MKYAGTLRELCGNYFGGGVVLAARSADGKQAIGMAPSKRVRGPGFKLAQFRIRGRPETEVPARAGKTPCGRGRCGVRTSSQCLDIKATASRRLDHRAMFPTETQARPVRRCGKGDRPRDLDAWPSWRRFMSVIYELRGKAAEFGDLGLNLYSGCAVGCRYCHDPWLRRMTWERWTTGVRPQSNILSELRRDAKEIEGDPRDILVCPAADPYQSDEAARLTRKALLILEHYDLRVAMVTIWRPAERPGISTFCAAIAGNTADAYPLSFGELLRGVGARRAADSPSESRRSAKPMRRESLLG